jgi:hypothetical protein
MAVSHGVIAAALFVLWFAYCFWRTRSQRDPIHFASHLVFLMFMVQMTFYELLPVQLHIAMVAAAMSLRQLEFPGGRPSST